MTPDDSDKRLREKIEKAFVPADLCNRNPDAIEPLLDAAKAEAFSEDKIQRMLKKLKGEIPLGEREKEEEQSPVWTESELTEEEDALVALHRNSGGELPPEVEEKLRRLREQAKSEMREKDNGDD
jgi:hypothetical protein